MIKKLAVIVTRGAYNNLLQVCELTRVAAMSGSRVSVLFRDEAASKMALDKITGLTFSEGYKGRESRVRDTLRTQKRDDLQELFREIKQLGDVKFSVCRESVELFDLTVQQLIPEIDEIQRLDSFWKEEVAEADKVLTF
ncbi:MAG: DsrE family protein [Nitrospirales bacterium]